MSELIFEAKGMRTRIRPVGESIIRVTHTMRSEFLNTDSLVVTARGSIDANISQTDDCYVLHTDAITVRVDKSSGAAAFYASDGHLLLQEPKNCPHMLQEKPVYLNRYDDSGEVVEEMSVDGIRAYARPAETYLDRTAYECRQWFSFNEDDALYGLGSHEEGIGNLRGKARLLYQHNMKAVVPVLVSTGGWGMLFDMGCMMSFRDDEQGSYLWADCADELDWYFFYGDGSYDSLMAQYRILTGEAPLLPRYAFGYVQSKERYVDAAEMLAVAQEYRQRHIPLDVMVLDWQSWPKDQWGWKTFDTTRFPDPKAFLDELHQNHVHFMISVWPTMRGEQNLDRQEMMQNDCMLGNRACYDAFNPQARALYWKQAMNLFDKGVDAWWCDCSEPFESDWRGALKPEPFMRAVINTEEAKRYIDPAKISLYSLYHAMGIFEGQRGVTSDKRVCNLTRSSYAGQHRYATITWSGDVSATWETLKRHIPEGMNFCATGEPWWSVDVGAFFPATNANCWFMKGDYPDGANDPGYRELFTRWMQYAAFLPMMRAHGTGTPREIWRFGEPGEPFYDAIADAIRLRYRLLPYIYTLAADTAFHGVPMLRVPALVFPQDVCARSIDSEMMLGDALLVKPITRPMYYGPGGTAIEHAVMTEQVYLPEGHTWYNWYTNEQHTGGETVQAETPIDVIPLFVRSGAILPLGGDAQYADEQAAMPLELTIYPGEDGTICLYDDAGDGYGYEQGEFSRILCTWDNESSALTIHQREGHYPGMAMERDMIIHCVGRKDVCLTYRGDEITVVMKVLAPQ